MQPALPVFTKEGPPPKLDGKKLPTAPPLTIHNQGIFNLLKKLTPHKSPGPDGIHPFVLQKCAAEIAPVLTKIYNQSINAGTIPSAWSKANISTIYKKGSRTDPSNYRPISLTSICCKIMEHVIYSHIMYHLNQHKALSNYQHGFIARRSCETQLLTTFHKILEANENSHQVDAIVLDLTLSLTAGCCSSWKDLVLTGVFISGFHPSFLGGNNL